MQDGIRRQEQMIESTIQEAEHLINEIYNWMNQHSEAGSKDPSLFEDFNQICEDLKEVAMSSSLRY